MRAVLLISPQRRPPAQLSPEAWTALRSGRLVTTEPGHPQLPALAAAGSPAEVLAVDELPATVADLLAGDQPLVWLTSEPAETQRLLAAAGADVELLAGAAEPAGTAVLDLVATMDRLRSPGGCPWDAEQTHTSLAPFLLEEAYETIDAIEAGDLAALREELGDVLLQVVFHARLAEELPDGERWSIDDVASGIVRKLVRRHPHVFADTVVSGAADVVANWEVIKRAEKGRTSVVEGVALSQPALSLAASLQQKAERLGLPVSLLGLGAAETPGQAVADAAAAVTRAGGVEAVGDLLFAAVTLARAAGVDAEAALRGRTRRFRDRLMAVERDLRERELDPSAVDAREWQARWER